MINKYLHNLSQQYPHGIVFHYFQGGKHLPAQGAISAEEFEQTLLYIGLENILPAEEWLQKAESNTLQDTDLCITFDDGLREQYDIAAPVLKKHGITAFFFVYSSPMKGVPVNIELYRHIRNACFPSMIDFYNAFDNVVAHSAYAEECEKALSTFDHTEYMKQYSFHTPEDKKFRFLRDDVLKSNRYDYIMNTMIQKLEEQGIIDTTTVANDIWMNDDNIRNLESQGHVLGMHSYTHPTTIGRLPEEEQYEEYKKNYDHLSGVLSSPPCSMSHPCNSYNEDTIKVLQELGITIGFRSDMGKHNGSYAWPRNDNMFLLKDLRRLST